MLTPKSKAMQSEVQCDENQVADLWAALIFTLFIKLLDEELLSFCCPQDISMWQRKSNPKEDQGRFHLS